MKTQHTPGPWTHKATASLGPQYAVYGESDRTGRDVAVVYNNGNEAEANARLIAAAPELLEALEKAADWLSRSTRIDDREQAEDARFAARKATL